MIELNTIWKRAILVLGTMILADIFISLPINIYIKNSWDFAPADIVFVVNALFIIISAFIIRLRGFSIGPFKFSTRIYLAKYKPIQKRLFLFGCFVAAATIYVLMWYVIFDALAYYQRGFLMMSKFISLSFTGLFLLTPNPFAKTPNISPPTPSHLTKEEQDFRVWHNRTQIHVPPPHLPIHDPHKHKNLFD